MELELQTLYGVLLSACCSLVTPLTNLNSIIEFQLFTNNFFRNLYNCFLFNKNYWCWRFKCQSIKIKNTAPPHSYSSVDVRLAQVDSIGPPKTGQHNNCAQQNFGGNNFGIDHYQHGQHFLLLEGLCQRAGPGRRDAQAGACHQATTRQPRPTLCRSDWKLFESANRSTSILEVPLIILFFGMLWSCCKW